MTTPVAHPAGAGHSAHDALAYDTARTPLLGRVDELRHVSAFAEAAGRTPVIVVTGPPGIGRSRLLRDASAIQDTRGRVVLRASCRPGGEDRRFGLAGDLLASAVGSAEPRAEADPPGRPAPGRGASAPADPASLLRLAASLAQSAPLCVYVDDIHWADPDSITWLSDLRARLAGPAVRVVVSLSEWEPQPEPLKAFLAGAGVKRLSLRPLSATEVAALVAGTLGSVDPAFTAGFFERTRGNPKLVTELVAELRHRGTALDDQDMRVLRAAADDVLASFLRPILLDHSPEAVLLAHAVSLLGSVADREAVLRLSGLDDAVVAVAITRLRQTGLVDLREDLLEVRYPAVGDVVESILGADDIISSRLAAARILGTRPETAERGATLLLSVEPQGQRWIADQLTAAARQAIGRRDVRRAVRMLRRALKEARQDPRADSIREYLAAAEAVFDPDRAVIRLDRLLGRVTQPADRARLLDLLAEAYLFGGRAAEAATAIDSELATVSAADGPVHRTLLAWRSLLEDERPGTRALRQGRTPASSSGPILRVVGGRRGLAQGRPPVAVTAPGELADSGGTSVALAATTSLTLAYRLPEAAAHLDHIIEGARDQGRAARWARASAQRAEVAYRAGDLATAISRARESLELTEWVVTPLRLSPTAILVRALVEQAELEQAGAVVALVPSLDREDWRWGEILHARGEVRLAQGDLWGSLDDLYTCGRLQQAHGRFAPAYNEWRLPAALALAALGDQSEAVRVASEAHRLAAHWGIAAMTGAALRVLGTVSGDESRVEAAVAALEQTPARLELAKALTERAAFQLPVNPVLARETARRASSIAGECGAHGLAQRLDQLMVSAGGRPRRPASGLQSLTRRQLLVAVRAAKGLTNREIAEELVLTQRTVELHLTNVYKKLNIASRSQLQRLVAEEAGDLDA